MNDSEQAERVRAAVNRAAFNQHLKEVLESRRIDCVLDVGAHEGGFGKTLRGLGYRDLIVSFEPVESSFEILQRTAAEQPPWVVHRFALGDRNEEREINVFAGTDVSSLHEPSAYARSLAPEMLELDRREVVTVGPSTTCSMAGGSRPPTRSCC
jgi:FkbM family methyltransferase